MSKKNVLIKENIYLNQPGVSRTEAIFAAGKCLVESGYVTDKYIDGMLRRDESLSVYIGNMLAIPHGEFDVMSEIKQSGIVVMVYPEGIDWHGETVKVVLGIAGIGDEHMSILSNMAEIFSELERVEQIIASNDVNEVYRLLTEVSA